MYTYFITPTDVKDLTNISDNLSEKYILTAIREAQQTELTTVLGIHFITKLEEAVNKGEVSERYSELLDNYILYFLCYNVISKLIPIASVKIDNAGAITTGDEKVENLSLDEVFRLQDYYTQKSDYYKMRLQRYLMANRTKYPELDCTSEIHSAYSSPIFLGGKRGKHIIRPCYHTCGHISPEKPDTPDTPEKPYYEVLYTVDGYVHDFDEYQEGERIIPAIAPEKDGYTFQYWEGLPEYMPANDITVTAVYHEIPSGEQVYYTLRYRVADWREDGEISFDNMAYIPEPFEWLQVVEREYNPETREGWAKLTHPNLRFDSEIKLQKFTGYDALFMLDLSEFNNAYMTDRMFAENNTLREFYPPKGLVGMEGYDFYNCQYLSSVNFATADGYQLYQPYSYPMTGAFSNCVSLTAILADNQQHMYSDNGNLYNSSDELIAARYGEVTIKDGCTCIKGEALKAHGLSTLTIPASVRRIEAYAISENQNLTDVYFGGTMNEWANIEKDAVNTIFVDTQVQVIHCIDGDCPVDYAGGGEEPSQYKIDVYLEWDYYTTQWYNEGDLIVLPEPPVLDGFTFQNWNWSNGTEWIDAMEYMPRFNLQVHATYTANIYKLTYKVDGEIVSEENVEYGTGIMAMEEPVKEGHTFSGWSEIPETMPAHDVEINGTFSINTYTVTFYVDGEEYHKETVVYGDVIPLPQEPSKEGFTFSHWYGDLHYPTRMPSHDIDTYAIFERNEYKITYTIDGIPYNEARYYFEDEVTPYIPTLEDGYVFNGWDNEPTVMPAMDLIVTGSMTKVEEPSEKPYDEQYFTIEALESGTFTVSGSSTTFQMSTDNGSTWNTATSVELNEGEKVLVKSTASKGKVLGGVSSTGNFNAYGNTMSLVYGDDFKGKTDLTGYTWVFNNFFKKCLKLIDASNLILPATVLADYCYQGMFNNCKALVAAPQLPALTMKTQCYQEMFFSCESLQAPPQLPATTLAGSCYNGMFRWCNFTDISDFELPATVLATSCYNGMFQQCEKLVNAGLTLPALNLAVNCYRDMFNACVLLTTAPELPATILTDYCYYNMFNGCSKLSHITILATDISANNCLNYWLNSVASTGTFKCVSGVNYPQGTSGIPNGWTVEYL